MEDGSMLKKLVMWFACFGLSFLAAIFVGVELRKAFMFVYFCAVWLIISLLIFSGRQTGIALAVGYVIGCAIMLFATWVFAKVFNANYYVVFQIITFLQCVLFNEKQEKREK
jgi:hypothetical protein